MSYTESLTELEKIVAELRSESCDVDTLVARTNRAVELLNQCRKYLTATEEELAAALETLKNPEQ